MLEPAQAPAVAGIDTLARNKRQHKAFAFARLALVLLFMALWVVLIPIGYPMPVGFVLVLAAEAAVLLAYRWRLAKVQEERTLHRLHYLLLALELVFHTGIVYFLGGLSWLGSVAYIYALMYATVFLSPRQAVAFTVAVAAAFITVVSLDGLGVVPHQWYLPQGPDRFRDLGFVVTTTVAFIGVLATVTFWMVFIGSEVRRERDEALRANAELMTVQGQLRALNEELERKVEERTEALLKRAETDQLTGLLNRGAVTRRFRELLALAQSGGRPLAVVLAAGHQRAGGGKDVPPSGAVHREEEGPRLGGAAGADPELRHCGLPQLRQRRRRPHPVGGPGDVPGEARRRQPLAFHWGS